MEPAPRSKAVPALRVSEVGTVKLSLVENPEGGEGLLSSLSRAAAQDNSRGVYPTVRDARIQKPRSGERNPEAGSFSYGTNDDHYAVPATLPAETGVDAPDSFAATRLPG